jgi:L-malate glycosyltransferase
MTSDSEGLSLALMEAMMCSLPAIVSNVGDLGDIVTDGENGFLIGSRKPSDFAEKMKLILESESDYDKYSRNARASAERYKIENTVNRWDNILRSID